MVVEVKEMIEGTKKEEQETVVMDKLCVYSIRLLAADMVDKASSGHLGAVFGCAGLANALWGRIMKYSPQKSWMNRDRFVLSAGHASALQYVMLHLTGHGHGSDAVSMDQLKLFRQACSHTPGHPEFRMTPGVEVTTGPLGQGFANAVGMAIAESHLAARFNRPDFPLFDYHTYVLVGDGCLMEGISSEAASLAGHLQLSKLIVFYDDNKITIDGRTDITFTEDVGARFAAYGWNVVRLEDVDAFEAAPYERAVREAKSQKDKPSIIIMSTTIGIGAGPGVEGTPKAHGGKFSNLEKIREKWFTPESLEKTGDSTDNGVAEIVRQELKEMDADSTESRKTLPKFHVPKCVLSKFRQAGVQGDDMADQWEEMVKDYCQKFRSSEPALVADLENRLKGRCLSEGWLTKLTDYLRLEQQTISSNLRSLFNSSEEEESSTTQSTDSDGPPQIFKHKAGRIYVHEALKTLVESNPSFMGGSADVGTSCGGHFPAVQGHFLPPSYSARYPGASYAGRWIHFGVREHAGLAILNGICASACLIPYCTLFTVFFQYGLPAIRMASISKLPILYIGTHDSIDVGEDGPTHQPVEILPQLRAMPELLVFRPSCVDEIVGSLEVFAEQYDRPSSTDEQPQGLPPAQRPVFLMTSRGELGLPYKSNTRIRGQDGTRKGAYIIHDCCDELTMAKHVATGSCREMSPDIVLIGSGQDVALVMKAKEILLQWSQSLNDKLKTALNGFSTATCPPPALLKIRVVSMPCWELFDEQDAEYQDSVLLSSQKDVLRIYVEKAATKNTGHEKYAHCSIVMSSFGISGKAADVERKLEFTPEMVAAKVWSSWMDRGILLRSGDKNDHGFSTWMSQLSRRVEAQ